MNLVSVPERRVDDLMKSAERFILGREVQPGDWYIVRGTNEVVFVLGQPNFKRKSFFVVYGIKLKRFVPLTKFEPSGASSVYNWIPFFSQDTKTRKYRESRHD